MIMRQPAQKPAPLDPSRRLARKVMPFIAADSALLPPDTWIVAMLKDMYKTVAPFRRDVRTALALSAVAVGGLLAALGGGITLAVTGALTLATGAGVFAVVAASSGYAAWRGQKLWQRARQETAPVLKDEITRRYAAYKIEEIASAFRARLEASRAAKAAAGAPVAKVAPTPVEKTPPVKSLRQIFARKLADKDHALPKGAAPKSPPQP